MTIYNKNSFIIIITIWNFAKILDELPMYFNKVHEINLLDFSLILSFISKLFYC